MTPFLEPDAHILERRAQWHHRGLVRPPFALDPGGEGESVWDYPRPPRLASDTRRVVVQKDDFVVASTQRAIRVLETASPPTFYLPPADVRVDKLSESGPTSLCEWKGAASDLHLEGDLTPVGWVYPRVFEEFEDIAGWYAFYPGRIDCFVDGERVRAQPGGYYGGWITQEIFGPFKGEPGYDGL